MSRFLVLGAFFLAGALLPPLVGCSPGDSTIGRLVDVVQGDALDAGAHAELERFRLAYRDLARGPDADRQLRHFSDAFKRTRANYVQPVDDREMIDAAIKGLAEMDPPPEPGKVEPAKLVEASLNAMLASLDPHSGYLNPEEFREIGVTTKGEFGGLGLSVGLEDGYVKVVAPIEDTPAERAGIKAGDLITHLDGESIKDLALRDAVNRMRGRPGTSIMLTIRRGQEPEFDVMLVRDIIEVKAIRWRTEGDIGYIRVVRFNAKTEDGLKDAVKDIRAKLGLGLKGIVLDLRDNPGGLLQQSVAVADAFIDQGRIVSVRGRDGRGDKTYDASSGDMAGGLPMVVLLNGGSASAAEIVAGALQDHRRAVLMGGRSFGKGSVQTVLALPIEGGLRLTTQLYYTPMERAIQALGVEPDIAVEGEEEPAAEEAEVEANGEAKKKKPRREADLPHALPAEARIVDRTRARLKEADCPAIMDGEKEDRMLGCAIDLLHSGSAEAYLSQKRAAGQL